VYESPPTKSVKPSASFETCWGWPETVTFSHPVASKSGQSTPNVTHATFSTVPTFPGEGTVPVTETWSRTFPLTATKVG
jgi:hypothetical protein